MKPGGRLIYATCSLLPRENQQQVEWFLAEHEEFSVAPVDEIWATVIGGKAPGPGPCLSLTPASHGTDGFFVAILARRPKAAAAP